MIYFDNAATTIQKPEEVKMAVLDAFERMGNAARGTHEASLSSMRLLYETRCLLQEMYHVEAPEQVVFTFNATDGLNMVINGLFSSKDHVITTCLEHNSVLRPLYRLSDEGMELSILPANQKGILNYEQLESMIKPNTKGVVMTHASNVTGNVTDLKSVGEICARYGIYFIVDGSQTAGVLPIPMDEYGISVLCLTGHKGLLGPQGTGVVLIRKGISIQPFRVGGSAISSYSKKHPAVMPTALEAGTMNLHGIAGLHGSLCYLKKTGISQIYQREKNLMEKFYQGVRSIPGVKLYGDFEQRERTAIVTLNLYDYDAALVSDELMERFSIATRSGAHCAPLIHECLGTKEQGAVRFSFSHFNTEEEIETGIKAVRILATEE